VPPRKAGEAFAALGALMSDLHASSDWRAEIDRPTSLVRPGHGVELRQHDHASGDLDQLGSIAPVTHRVHRFLTDSCARSAASVRRARRASGEGRRLLVLSTIHSAKGQEWKAVMILNVVDGSSPRTSPRATPAEIEEERRLLYVGMTRAREDLVLMQPLRFSIRGQTPGGDRHVYAPRSRFIQEADLEAFEVMRPHTTAGSASGVDEPVPTVVDLKATNASRCGGEAGSRTTVEGLRAVVSQDMMSK